ALGVLNNLSSINALVSKNILQLSSGYKINTAGDDPVGIAQVTQFQSQIAGYTQGISNLQVGSSVLGIASGAVTQQSTAIQGLVTAATAGANATTDLTTTNATINSLLTSIAKLSSTTNFNGQKLLDGSLSASAYNIQFGPGSGDNTDIRGAFASTSLASLSLPTSVNFTTTTDAQNFLNSLNTANTGAVAKVGQALNNIGNYQNTLTTYTNYVKVTNTNLTAAQATIRNVDVAATTAQLSQNQILQQITNAMLTQANNIPALALRLVSA
ncbi:MAG: hypothetical protein K2X66_15965, partial [Cyanobacteria bacterium]|nr:hypothetical protein [Cyanobacteriota bacterium]